MINFDKNNFSVFGAFFAAGSLVLIIFHFIDFDGLYGQDAYEYIRQATVIKSSLLSWTKPSDFYWAPGYPFVLAITDLIIGNMVITAQIVSVLCWSLSLFFIWKVSQLFDKQIKSINLFVIIGIVGFSAYFFRVFFTSMSDGLATLLITVSLYFFEKNRIEKRGYSMMWSAVFGSLSVLTRYASLPFVVVMIGLGLINLIRYKKWLHLSISVGVIIVFCLLFVFIKESSPDLILKNSIVSDWHISNYWKSTISNNQGILHYSFPNVLYVFYPIVHLGFIWVFIPLLAFGLTKRVKIQSMEIAIAISIYLLFLAGIPFQNKRFLVLVLPAIFILMIPFLKNLQSTLKKRTFSFGILTFVILNIGLSGFSFRTIYDIQQKEVMLCQQITGKNIDHLYTFDVDLALRSRGFNGNITNLWLADKIDPQQGDFFLLNPEKWKNQWENHQLMTHVNNILDSKKTIQISEFEGGWELWKYE